MGLEVGSKQAGSGMTKAIYEALERANQDTLNDAIEELPQEDQDKVRRKAGESWRKLDFPEQARK